MIIIGGDIINKLDELPVEVKEYLQSQKYALDNIIFSAKCDLTLDGFYGDTWLIAFKKEFITFTIHTFNKQKELDNNNIKHYKYDKLKEIKFESLVSGGMLTTYINDEFRAIIRFSNTYNNKFSILAKLLNKLREGKEIKDEDFHQDQMPKYCPKCGRMYPDSNTQICPKCLDKRSLFARVLSYTKKYKGGLVVIIFSMLISAILNVIRPYLQGNILFDQVLTEGGKYYGKLVEVILVIIAVHFTSVLFNIIQARIASTITAKMIYDMKCDIFSSMQKLSLKFYTDKQTGSLMTRINNDTTHLQYFFHEGLPYLLINSMMLITMVIVMFKISWFLTVLVLIPAPFIVLASKIIIPIMDKMYTNRYRKTRFMNALINDALTGFRVVKAFGKELDEINRFTKVNKNVAKVEYDVGKFTGTVYPIMHFVLGLGTLVVWGVGGWQVVNGDISLGVIITFTGYLGLLYQPLIFMTDIVQWWSDAMNSAKRIFEIVDAKPDIYDVPNPTSLSNIKGKININDITFGYEKHKPVIHNVTFEVKEGEMIGLVGHSGAGKSTITNLITRLYDIDEGSILIDGVNVKEIYSKDLRNQIGMVLQETFLFTGTISENIAFACPNASKDEIIRAAKAANAHDFIMKLPDGYDTVIGSKGQDLSGGQKQRISIARAILQNPRILILDEATASVDTETELKIQQALERLVKGRTTIAIAHRLSTLRNANKLVVIDHGKIAEKGTHEELVKKEGHYYKMLKQQEEALKFKGVSA